MSRLAGESPESAEWAKEVTENWHVRETLGVVPQFG
jgi:hypothetical protein